MKIQMFRLLKSDPVIREAVREIVREMVTEAVDTPDPTSWDVKGVRTIDVPNVESRLAQFDADQRQIIVAMIALVADAEDVTEDGMPDARALSRRLGKTITAAERTRLWDAWLATEAQD